MISKDRGADGLRGFAAINVLFSHFFSCFFPLGFDYMFPGNIDPKAPVHAFDFVVSQAPFTILWNGNFAVCVFFVLSGYVLTKSFVEHGDLDQIKVQVARRYFRLAVPIFGSVLVAYLLLSAGWDHWREAAAFTQSIRMNQFWNFSASGLTALREATFGSIFLGESSYNPVLWTMRVEFIGSLLVLACCVFSLKRWHAVAQFCPIVVALVVYFPSEWMLYLGFIAGMYVGRVRPGRPKWSLWLAAGVVLIGGCFDSSPLYAWAQHIPLTNFALKHCFNITGAIALLYLVRSGVFDRLLLSRIAQFFGRISFGLYLIHFSVLLTFTPWVFIRLMSVPGMPYSVGVMIDILLSIILILPLAKLYQATFDQWGINLSRQLFPSTKRGKDA